MKIISSGVDTIPQKYLDNRDIIKNGDIILYRGSSLMAKSIQYIDSAYYNHIGVVWKFQEQNKEEFRLLTLDMWTNGLSVIPLSKRMRGYDDFCILRPKIKCDEVKSYAVNESLKMWEDGVKYDFMLLLRVSIIKKTKIDITGLSSRKKFICSEFAQNYCKLLGIDTYKDIELITPEDFIRHIDNNFELILNTK